METKQNISGAQIYENRVQSEVLVKAAVNQVGGKKWCIEQAIKCGSLDPLKLAKDFYAFMCEA